MAGKKASTIKVPVSGTYALVSKAPAKAAAKPKRRKFMNARSESKSSSNGVVSALVVLLIALVILGIFMALENLPKVTITVAAPAAAAAPAAVAPAQPIANPQGAAPAELAAPANAAPIVLPAVAAGCPTEAQFKELTGVTADIVRTEACLFHWRGDPATIVAEHPCPLGYSCTLGINGANYQYNGDDSLAPMPIFAGSWRLLSQYPANDPVQNSCNFVVKVQTEGQISDPRWTVAPGNFSCP